MSEFYPTKSQRPNSQQTFHAFLDDSPTGEVDRADVADRARVLPAQMQLVIATREDPPLSLPRLRARSQVTEIRERDLRFTAQEAAAFLDETMGLPLSPDVVASLETRTEGWIAGLHLAALALQEERQDPAAFVAAFAGDDRYVSRFSSQGGAFLGIGLLLEGAGNDTYRVESDGQGFGGAGGRAGVSRGGLRHSGVQRGRLRLERLRVRPGLRHLLGAGG